MEDQFTADIQAPAAVSDWRLSPESEQIPLSPYSFLQSNKCQNTTEKNNLTLWSKCWVTIEWPTLEILSGKCAIGDPLPELVI